MSRPTGSGDDEYDIESEHDYGWRRLQRGISIIADRTDLSDESTVQSPL